MLNQEPGETIQSVEAYVEESIEGYYAYYSPLETRYLVVEEADTKKPENEPRFNCVYTTLTIQHHALSDNIRMSTTEYNKNEDGVVSNIDKKLLERVDDVSEIARMDSVVDFAAASIQIVKENGEVSIEV